MTLRLRTSVRRQDTGHTITLQCAAEAVVVHGVLPPVRVILDALATPQGWNDADHDDLALDALTQWEWLRRELFTRAALLYLTAHPDVALIPRTPTRTAWRALPHPGTTLTLRDDVFATWSAEGMLLQSPTAPDMVLLTHGDTTVLRQLAESQSVPASSDGLAVDTTLLDALWNAGLAVPVAGTAEPPRPPTLSLADRLLHAQSRGLRADTWRGKRSTAPYERRPPAHVTAAPVTHAAAPDTQAPPSIVALRTMFSQRRSVRTYAALPPTVADVCALLGGVMGQVANGGLGPRHRAYPSGGGLHALDAYVAVSACDGLAAGLYLYEADAAALRLVAGEHVARALVRTARRAAGQHDDGQLLLIAAVDLAYIATHYSGIAYTLALREVGAWMEVVQLVGSAMGLATCPVGSGDSALFARAVHTDPFAYTSLGEVLVGRAPETTA